MTETLRDNPDFAQAHYNLGLIFQDRKENDKAAREYRLALGSDPGMQVA